jgi:hypothetical protein
MENAWTASHSSRIDEPATLPVQLDAPHQYKQPAAKLRTRSFAQVVGQFGRFHVA